MDRPDTRFAGIFIVKLPPWNFSASFGAEFSSGMVIASFLGALIGSDFTSSGATSFTLLVELGSATWFSAIGAWAF
ncbi:MAG: hypothetical protein ACJAU2_001012 [Maribacter sp.]|jgi:hypothetical protein